MPTQQCLHLCALIFYHAVAKGIMSPSVPVVRLPSLLHANRRSVQVVVELLSLHLWLSRLQVVPILVVSSIVDLA